MPLEALVGTAGAGELERAGQIDHETVRRLACDASVTRIGSDHAPSRSMWAGEPPSSYPRSEEL